MKPNKPSNRLHPVLERLAFLLLFISVISIFDGTNRYLELMSHFKSQLFYGSVILFLLVFVLKQTKAALVALISIAINGFFIVPFYLLKATSPPTPNSAKTEIKIFLSNVYTGNTEYQKLISLLKTEQPDIVILQEVNTRWINNISEFMQDYPHRIIQPRSDNFGIALYSKLPSVKQNIVELGDASLPSIEGHFQINEHDFYLLATHPLPPVNQEYYFLRNNQLAASSSHLNDKDGAKLLIGDLNVTPWSSDYLALETNTGLTNVRKGFGILPTWPTQGPFLMIPIDHILISEEFQVTNLKTGPDIGSDHLPLIAELVLK